MTDPDQVLVRAALQAPTLKPAPAFAEILERASARHRRRTVVLAVASTGLCVAGAAAVIGISRNTDVPQGAQQLAQAGGASAGPARGTMTPLENTVDWTFIDATPKQARLFAVPTTCASDFRARAQQTADGSVEVGVTSIPGPASETPCAAAISYRIITVDLPRPLRSGEIPEGDACKPEMRSNDCGGLLFAAQETAKNGAD